MLKKNQFVNTAQTDRGFFLPEYGPETQTEIERFVESLPVLVT